MIKKYWIQYLILTNLLLCFFYQGIAQQIRPVRVTVSNAAVYRDNLKMKIFGTTVFPYDILPDSIITNVDTIEYYTGAPYNTIKYPSGNLDSVDKFVVSIGDNTTDFPSALKIYLFHPHNSNGKLFIYHSGHCASVTIAEDIIGNNRGEEPGVVIPALLAEGYTILAVPMLNYQFASLPGVRCGYNNHSELFTDGHYQYPLALFFRPLIASLNFLGRANYSSIYMCGLSGGGWTTSIYPAIDSSISMSFPVAGSWPMPVRYVFYPSVGDYEQYYPPIFSNFLDYHEIYTLACLSPARKMLQINNRYDECCFSGSDAHLYYVDSVVKALRGSDGIYKFYLDETSTSHAISKRAIKIILAFINNQSASLQTMPADTVINGENYSYDIRSNFLSNDTSDNNSLKYSLLKGPGWLNLDSVQGRLYGVVPAESVIPITDTISFKAEDSTGRFVLYNYKLVRKRTAPYFFTKFDDSSTIYFLPPLSKSIQAIDQLVRNSFYFNNPLLSVTRLTIENNSIIKINLNTILSENDSIGYRGSSDPYAILYKNGSALEDFGLAKINRDIVSRNYAVAGMIRFNTETTKFEYFNGVSWIDLN